MYVIEGRYIGMLLTSVNPVKYDVGCHLLLSLLCPILKWFTRRCLLNANIFVRELIHPLINNCLIFKSTLYNQSKFFYWKLFQFFCYSMLLGWFINKSLFYNHKIVNKKRNQTLLVKKNSLPFLYTTDKSDDNTSGKNINSCES